MTKVLVTRTAPGAATTMARLKALGFEPVSAATAIIRPLEVAWPDGIEAIAVTSPNGARRAVALSPTKSLPVYAVGDATAHVMRDAGFGDVTSASGDGRALARLIVEESAPRPLVHIRGADQSFDLVSALKTEGIEATGLVAYTADRVDALPEAALSAIRPGQVLLIHSAKGASRFLQLAGKAAP